MRTVADLRRILDVLVATNPNSDNYPIRLIINDSTNGPVGDGEQWTGYGFHPDPEPCLVLTHTPWPYAIDTGKEMQ